MPAISPKNLPPRPNLQHLKYQALDLLRAARSGNADAVSRLGTPAGATLSLADAQRTIAREYGYPSWPKLKGHVESIVGPPDIGPAYGLEPFIAAVRSGDAGAVRNLLTEQPALRKKIDSPVFDMDTPAIVHARHDRAMVDVLLEFGADINGHGQFWGRSLGVLDEVSLEMHAYLVSRGAVPDVGAFADAVKSGDVAATRRLLQSNPSLRQHVNRPMFPFGGRPIHQAKKNLPMLDLLLEYGADINLRSDWWAGSFGVLDLTDPATAEALIARGAYVDIHAAAHLGNLDRVKELVAHDPSLVEAKGGDGKRPLHVASTKGIIDFLLDRGAEIDARCVDHLSTPAQYAVREPWRCRYLIERGATPDIYIAAALGDADLAAALIEEDPDCVTARVGAPGYPPVPVGAAGSIYQWELPAKTPHEVAAALGHRHVYDLLMRHTPEAHRFVLACASGDEAVVREMTAARPELMEEFIRSHPRALADIAWRGQLGAVRLLLDGGFPTDETGGGEGTALDRAAIRGYADIVKLLLSRGADVTIKNVYGGMPLGACMWGSLNFRDPKGDYAATAEALIAAGAKVPEKASGSEELAAVLRRHGAKG